MIEEEVDRGCEETLAAMVGVGALREMLEQAVGYRADIVEGRYVIDARHRRKRWEIIVEPDAVVRRLVVVTAYPLGR